MHRHPHRDMQPHSCLLAHRLGEIPRDYTNTEIHKERQRQRERTREAKGRVRETKPMYSFLGMFLWDIYADLSPILTSPIVRAG